MKLRLPLFLLALAAAGCGPEPVEYRVEPSSYYTYGYYVGSKANVKIFVEELTFVEEQNGMLAAELAILNERPTPLRFIAIENKLAVGGRKVQCQGSEVLVIKPGDLQHVTLQFRTGQGWLDRATLEINGAEVEMGTRLHFDVPFYAAAREEHEEPKFQRGGLHREKD